MKTKTYTVTSKKDELVAGSTRCLSLLEALLKSKEILTETREPAIITELVIENNKIVSSREVYLEIVAKVTCDNCLGSGTTDELNSCTCTFCAGTGRVES